MYKQAYELGVELALRDAGLVKEAGEESAKKGFGRGAIVGSGAALAGLLASLLSKGKYGLHGGPGTMYGPALLGGATGAGIGALMED